MTNPYEALDQKIVGDSYTSRELMDNLAVLCDDFGSRFGGTLGERQAAEFIQKKFREYGLSNVHLEPVEYLGWTRVEASLEIISPIQKTIPCISLPHSPPVEMEGMIIDMGAGAPEDFDDYADEIKGKIVMVNSEMNPKKSGRWVHRNEKFARSALAGATGFIFVNHYPGYGPATGGIGHNGKAALIPGISISKEDGAFIQRLGQRHGPVKVRLVTTDMFAPMISWNIVGELPGDQFPQEIVMLGSHYDGHDISQGAVDPASGVVSVMEAARVLSKYAAPLPRTIRFVMWGIEEIGLLGSTAYVAAHADQLKNIRFYLNMDAAGGDAPKDINLHKWPELQATFDGYQQDMALDFSIGQTFHTASDHFPFLMSGVVTGGVEAVRETRTGRGYGHTYYDTVDKVKLVNLREAATLAARIALRVAQDENWPVSSRDAQAVAELMDGPDQQASREVYDRLDSLYR
ncbi:MAG: M28 family peptidase [Anaerolineales bacterium]|jgi:Zn-dependent M28 family amino/carboxypeptidase